MKTIAIVVCVLLLVQGKEFQRLQEILDFDASSIGEGNCQSDAEYTETLASYDGWIDLAGMGQLEQDEDLDVLEEAQQHIVDVRAILIGIQESIKESGQIPDFEAAVPDPDGVAEVEDEEDSEEDSEESVVGRNGAGINQNEQDNATEGDNDAVEEDGEEDSDSESDSEDELTRQSGAQNTSGKGKRKLRKGKRIVKKVHHEGRHRIRKAQASFVQVITKITHSKIKQQMENIINMVQSLDVEQSDDQDQDLIEKVKLCDLILEELGELIKGLNALRYDEAFYNKTLETLNNGRKALLKAIKDCGVVVQENNDNEDNDDDNGEQAENNEEDDGEGEADEQPEDDHELGDNDNEVGQDDHQNDDGEESNQEQEVQEQQQDQQTDDGDNQDAPATDAPATDDQEESDSESESETQGGNVRGTKNHHHHKKGKGHRHVKTVQVRRLKHHGDVSFLQIGQQYGEEMDLINSEILKQQSQILQNQGVIGFLRNSPRRVTFY